MDIDPGKPKKGKLRFLRDFLGHNNFVYKKGSEWDVTYFADKDRTEYIIFKQGTHLWNDPKLGADVEVVGQK